MLDSPAVNAFALPGGFIYITRGILPYLDNEAQLVGVLGHEIGHVTARHSAQQYTRSMGASLGVLVGSIFVPQMRPFGDLAQSEHRRAVPQVRSRRRAAGRRAGRRVRRGRTVGSRRGARVPDDARADCGDDGSQRRAELAVDASAAREPRGARHRNGEEGADRRRGRTSRGRSIATAILRASTASSSATTRKKAIVRGNMFLHPPLRFAIEFPQGWEITNSDEQVVAQEPGNKVFMVLRTIESRRGELARSGGAAAHARVGLQGDGRDVGDHRRHAGGCRHVRRERVGHRQGDGARRARVGAVGAQKDTFFIGGIASPDLYPRVVGDFDRRFNRSGR